MAKNKTSEFTSKKLNNIKSGMKDIIINDDEITGLFCKITPKGKKSFGVYYRLEDGTQRRPSIGVFGINMTVQQARDKAKQILVDAKNGIDYSSAKSLLKSEPTVDELKDKYFGATTHKKPKTREEELRLWNNHLSKAIGNIKVSKVSMQDIEKMKSSFDKKRTTANRLISLSSIFFSLCEQWGIRQDGTNPCRHIKKYKENKREIFLKSDEIEKLFQYLNDAEVNRTISSSAINAVRLLLLTGCRLNEILTLKWEHINFETKHIYLPDSKTGNKIVYLSEYAIAILNAIERVKNNSFVIVGAKEGKCLVNLQKTWKKTRIELGLNNVRLHDLRHSVASAAAAQGCDLLLIGKILGHKSVSSTARYAHLVSKQIHDGVNKFGDAMMKTQLTNNFE